MALTEREVLAQHDGASDAALLARSVDQPDCFAALFDRHAPALYRYIARRLGPDAADDLVSEAFLIAFRRRGSFDGSQSDARPWLYGIVTNLIGRHRRDEVRFLRAIARTGTDPARAAGDALPALPECKTLRSFVNVDGGQTYRCAECEWFWSLTAGSPAGTATAPLAQGGTAVTVTSGGAAFTSGMQVLYDSGTSAEVLNVGPGATGMSVPVSAAVKAHTAGATFGKLVTSSTLGGVGQLAVPQLPGISVVN